MICPHGIHGAGVAMLSSVLNSKQAILINIQIIAFLTHISEMLPDQTSWDININGDKWLNL